MRRSEALARWKIEDALELYGIRNWGAGYFDVSAQGEITVNPSANAEGPRVSIMDIIAGIRERGMDMPVLLRFRDILASRMDKLHSGFQDAIRDAGYRGAYRGVYPIKVNQQQQVIEEVVDHGRGYHHGLEVGSKAELIAAMGYLEDPEAVVVCNGYKDEEFVDLALCARKVGVQLYLVIEMPDELEMVINRAARMGVRPLLGVRAKLAARGSGHWTDSAGDRSVFGLNVQEIIDVLDRLREKGMLDCMRMLHYHLGSQISNIRNIRAAAAEAARIYVDMVREGARMGLLNVGGGLAVDYDGSHTNFASSSNYTIREYAADIIEVVMASCDETGVEHPVIVSESGRALVSHHAVLVFNVLGVSRFESDGTPDDLGDGAHEMLQNLLEVDRMLTSKNVQECYHDALYYRDEIRSLFEHGVLSLRDRARGERIFWRIVGRIAREIEDRKYVPDEMEGLDGAIADVYYGNFSVFQSLPDVWAIEQLFPVVPVHRLDERPTRRATLADITCDCDGKIDRFVDLHDVKQTLPLHDFRGEEYYLGVFLVGAYQETLGDLHNLLGDTNVVNVVVGDDGRPDFVGVVEGDTVADVLGCLEYDTGALERRVARIASRAVAAGRITAEEREQIMEAYYAGLNGYTYFES